jgi:hypothetical protein
MPSPSTVRFHVPREICSLQPVDCPISDDLASALESLEVHSFEDVHTVSLQDLRRLGDKNGLLALELGSVIRRAARGEFGKPYSSAEQEEWVAPFWWKGATTPADHTTHADAATAVAPDTFCIPDHARGIEITALPMSTRLRHNLLFFGLQYLGGLHGVTGKQILTLEGCGPKSLEELRRVVSDVLSGRVLPNPPRGAPVERRPQKRFSVPPDLHCLSPYSFPMSRRLDGVLRRAGIVCLGDLQGLPFHDLLVQVYCGPQTIRELLRLLERLASAAMETDACRAG